MSNVRKMPPRNTDPPEWLPGRAHAHYRRLAEQVQALSVGSPFDFEVLIAATAGTVAQLQEVEGVLLEQGQTYTTETPDGVSVERLRPEVRARALLVRELPEQLAALGLTPRSRRAQKGEP